MNLLLFEAHELGPQGRVVLADGRARHVRDVLRAVPGQTLRAGIVDGALGSCNVLELHSDRVIFDASALSGGSVPVRPRVDLLLAMPRPKVFARLLPALAALGVGRVLVTNAARVERYYFDSHRLGSDEIRRRFLEGLAQSGDTRVPELTLHRSFKKLVQDELPARTARLFADVDERRTLPSIRQAAGELNASERVLLAIGPEGGWVDFERGLLAAGGFVAVSLGARVLTSDVACVLGLGLAHDALRR